MPGPGVITPESTVCELQLLGEKSSLSSSSNCLRSFSGRNDGSMVEWLCVNSTLAITRFSLSFDNFNLMCQGQLVFCVLKLKITCNNYTICQYLSKTHVLIFNGVLPSAAAVPFLGLNLPLFSQVNLMRWYTNSFLKPSRATSLSVIVFESRWFNRTPSLFAISRALSLIDLKSEKFWPRVKAILLCRLRLLKHKITIMPQKLFEFPSQEKKFKYYQILHTKLKIEVYLSTKNILIPSHLNKFLNWHTRV